MKNKDLTKPGVLASAPVVQFIADIEKLEGYADTGMRARLVSAVRDSGMDTVTLRFDYQEFEEHNRDLETPNYYDKMGKPTLTAREAGYYRPQEEFCFLPADAVPFEFLNPAQEALLREFAQSGATSYLKWLEDSIIAARGGAL